MGLSDILHRNQNNVKHTFLSAQRSVLSFNPKSSPFTVSKLSCTSHTPPSFPSSLRPFVPSSFLFLWSPLESSHLLDARSHIHQGLLHSFYLRGYRSHYFCHLAVMLSYMYAYMQLILFLVLSIIHDRQSFILTLVPLFSFTLHRHRIIGPSSSSRSPSCP